MKKDYVKPQISITSLRPEERIAAVISGDERDSLLLSIQSFISPGSNTGSY